MEMLQAGRADPWRMLDNAEEGLGCTRARRARWSRCGRATPSWSTPVPPSGRGARGRRQRPHPCWRRRHRSRPAAGGDAAGPRVRAAVRRGSPREHRAARDAVPAVGAEPARRGALREVRRVFHTLKGSGRMVGARRIADFSWSIESLLNRVISQTLARSPEIVAIVRESVATLPVLVDELEQGAPAGIALDGLMARADALSGREAPVALPEPPVAAPAAPEPEVAAAGEPAGPRLNQCPPSRYRRSQSPRLRRRPSQPPWTRCCTTSSARRRRATSQWCAATSSAAAIRWRRTRSPRRSIAPATRSAASRRRRARARASRWPSRWSVTCASCTTTATACPRKAWRCCAIRW